MEILRKHASEVNIDLKGEIITKFSIYKDLLLEWNQKINLTAITDDEAIAIKHFIDSIIPINNFKDNSKIIDVGSGAGFPSVPLSIVNETLKITALDSLNKRLIFLQKVQEELSLNRMSFIHGRAEDFGRDTKYRESYDYATARAVASLNVLSELCLPLVKVGGHFVAYKGDKWEQEIEEGKNAIKKLGGEVVDVQQYTLPQINDSRSVIIIRKVDSTNTKYPRKAGVPNKKPLT